MASSEPILRLSRHGRFRVERAGYILLCHCKYLQDFRLPLDCLEFLRRLSAEGVCEGETLTKQEQELVDDLRAVSLLDNTHVGMDEARTRSASLWDRIGYMEEL